jgi:hypothetical protein
MTFQLVAYISVNKQIDEVNISFFRFRYDALTLNNFCS